ncbi:MAG TPA: carbonic anhydrase [Polyangiaceae bacterium]|nr:carbonic anhydrase [Polyangiaceae bacterium]
MKAQPFEPFWESVPLPFRIALLTFSLAAFGCNQLKALAGDNKKKQKPPAPIEAPAAAAPAPAEPARAPAVDPAEPARYGVPFAWESSPNEPLARARGFLAEALRANQIAVGLGRQHYAPFLTGQTPRATVVTCADSRVQSAAWDQTPENDDFTVRNIGNQVSNALGSVEYGVEELHTPLLLVVGHTGCGAVKAAMGKPDELSPAIRAELAALKLPAPRKGVSPEEAWTGAVSANVNAQVQLATEHFAELVHSGELTVVGAVYDFRNDLGKGYGRLQVINVNTNTDPSRIEAFLKAVQGPTGAVGSHALPPANATPTGSVTLNGKPVGVDETVEERVKKIIDRAQRALPGGKKPNVTVSVSETEHAD